MRVSMYFLHLELTFTPHYITMDKGLFLKPVMSISFTCVSSVFELFHKALMCGSFHLPMDLIYICGGSIIGFRVY